MKSETRKQFIRGIAEVVNKLSLENDSNTPDYIIAEFLADCLVGYNNLVAARNDWFDTVGWTKQNDNHETIKP